jgi:hypothetical protein
MEPITGGTASDDEPGKDGRRARVGPRNLPLHVAAAAEAQQHVEESDREEDSEAT